MNKPTKIAVVDDQHLFRKGLISLLKEFDGLEVLYEASNGQELIALIKKKRPDVILLDIEMPVMDGIKTAEYLQANYPGIKILILTMHNEEEMIVHLIEKGAHGFLLKDSSIEVVVESIHSVIKSGHYFNDHISQIMIKKIVNNRNVVPDFTKASLSEREIEVVKLICKELTNKEIADKLCISVRTVDGHRENILKKIHAKNSIGLVMYAFNNGLLK